MVAQGWELRNTSEVCEVDRGGMSFSQHWCGVQLGKQSAKGIRGYSQEEGSGGKRSTGLRKTDNQACILPLSIVRPTTHKQISKLLCKLSGHIDKVIVDFAILSEMEFSICSSFATHPPIYQHVFRAIAHFRSSTAYQIPIPHNQLPNTPGMHLYHLSSHHPPTSSISHHVIPLSSLSSTAS